MTTSSGNKSSAKFADTPHRIKKIGIQTKLKITRSFSKCKRRSNKKRPLLKDNKLIKTTKDRYTKL